MDQQGAPVAGVTVVLLPEGNLVLDVAKGGMIAANPTGKTDTHGRFSLRLDTERFKGSGSFQLYWVTRSDTFMPIVDAAGNPLVVFPIHPTAGSDLGTLVVKER